MPTTPDRRIWPVADGVAHRRVAEKVGAEEARLTEGEWMRVHSPVVDLCASPEGARDRQLLLGARFCVVTQRLAKSHGLAESWAFGFHDADGYCGWVRLSELGPDHGVTHWVSTPATHLYPAADMKQRELASLSLGSKVAVTAVGDEFAQTSGGFVPRGHLRGIGDWAGDAVAVARGLIGTPYLWGGNSRAGIDCSGLVQIARHACGLSCAADSDQQQAMPGEAVALDDAQPGDLVFWAGHVGMIAAPGRLLHANAYHMAVVEEGLQTAIDRIAVKGTPVLACLRPSSIELRALS